MRYLFAAVIAVLFIIADFEGSNTQSIWTEPFFVVAVAHPEPAAVSPESHTGIIAASEPSSKSRAPDVEPARDERANEANAATNAAVAIDGESSPPNLICEAIKTAAEENDIPIGFFARLLWQESRFRSEEVSSAGAQGIAQFMPRTALEVGLSNPFDPLQAIPASARFLRKLHDQFGNLGLAAAAYNAGGGRIERWLSRRGPLPKETRAYVKIITGHKAEDWTDAENTVSMPTDLPEKAPCEGVGGLSKSKKDQVAEMPVDLAPSVSAMLAKAEAREERHAALKKSRLVTRHTRAKVRTAARKMNARAAQLAGRTATRKAGKQPVVRLASDAAAGGRAKSSKAPREL